MNNRAPLGHQWWALAFSLFSLAALIDPLQRHAGSVELTLTSVGIAIFIALYTAAMLAWKRGDSGLWQTCGIVLIGVAFAPFNAAGWIFFVVASAFAPWIAAGNTRQVALIVAGVIGVAVIENIVMRFPWSFAGIIAADSIITATVTNMTLRRAIAVRELARHNERERIARDMHDVLGHTLSLIILKTDLAARVAHQNPDRAVAELAEVDRIARETLDEVRQTLRGYSARSLESEFECARRTLEIAGFKVTTEFAPPQLAPPQENALCLALREGVTNILRHARATHCRLSVTSRYGNCQLEIEDDGLRDSASEGRTEGQGLRGMRERVSASGGTVSERSEQGTTLIIKFPLMSNAEVSA